VGTGTRAAIKKAQLKYGLPADAYPSPELLARLKTGDSTAREVPARPQAPQRSYR
jgi:peptidoglycan hydrolase-like protein with peptidoglycan-binding domain